MNGEKKQIKIILNNLPKSKELKTEKTIKKEKIENNDFKTEKKVQ